MTEFVWQTGDLNQEQEDAIRQEGSVYLVACPGSGKTRALIYKAALELSRLQSKRQFVVAITYTNRAADEIKERIELLGVETDQLWIGTIHSFCLEWILKPYAIYHDQLKYGFSVINSHDSEELLTSICSASGAKVAYWDCGYYFVPGGYVLSCLEQHKHRALNAVFAQYFQALSAGRKIDFELILYYAHQLITSNPSIASILSNLFRFVLVDEFQDTKLIQYEIVAAILRAGQGRSDAFVVGDPNQSIYGSLGGQAMPAADLSRLSNTVFRELSLDRNYRSSARITGYFAAFNVYQTRCVAASAHAAFPSLITYNRAVARGNLQEEIVRLIRLNVEQRNIPQHEVCILAPWWVVLAGMTRRLVAALPQYQFNGPGMVPFSRDVENVWYKLARIVLTQASPSMFIRRIRWAREVIVDLEHANCAPASLTDRSLLKACNGVNVDADDGLTYLEQAFEQVFVSINADFRTAPALVDHHNTFFASSRDRIRKLANDGVDFTDVASFRRVFENRQGITISTIHGIKGDEFDAVIVFSLLEGMVPHFADADGVNSAKKMLYVAASRARKHLHLISETGRGQRGRGDYPPTDALLAHRFNYDL